MEAIDISGVNHHLSLDIDHNKNIGDINHCSATATAICTKLLLDQGRHSFEFESYPSKAQLLQVQQKEKKSRSGADENQIHDMVSMDMNQVTLNEVRSSATTSECDPRIGHHDHLGPIMVPVSSQYDFPLKSTLTADKLETLQDRLNNNKTPSPPSSLSSSRHYTPSCHKQSGQQIQHQNQQPIPMHRSPVSMTTLSPTSLHSPMSAGVHPHMGRDRIILPPGPSDVSEAPFDAFAEGEVLEMENDSWDQRSPYYYAAQLRAATARCSSSTLFEETRPLSSLGSWSKDGIDSQQTSPVNLHSSSPFFQTPQKASCHKKQARVFVKEASSDSLRSNQTVVEPFSSEEQQKIEPSTPVRPSSHDGVSQLSTKDSPSQLNTPTTPLAPMPTELDKSTKNLMMFNKIPRQWPSSQETLHHNFVAKAKKQVIKEFDIATAERIDRVINKEKPLSRAAKERLAAEQKEVELEIRGFFDPTRRWKGRDVYPRPANWVYCRRTKNNWLEKTKILADNYKLFKGQVLGKGHHADVYKGIDLTTGQDLAIKVIYKTVNRRLGFVNEDSNQEVKNRRLLNEAWFIDYLKDAPGICKMLRVVETATKFYFVMELAQSDLNSYSNGINMREEEIRHILKPIFECLKFAHSQDITHRDIKPENILLRTRKDWLHNHSQSISPDTKSKNQGSKNEKKKNSNQNNKSPRAPLHQITDDSSTFVNESSNMDMDTTDGHSSIDTSTLYNLDHRFDAFLADWGLAVEHDCLSGKKPVGTPLYAAPE
ncbi:CBL-interacting serine/threonine-protein kinase 20, partial [Entomortierella beljakovae]